jgi:acetyl-CoA carboxylase carboxyltransferase component
VVTGSGKVFGRPVFAFSQDFTGGGALGGFSIASGCAAGGEPRAG